ncbi:antibiotic biosynthesis monooxygenase family protein [Algiphilus sp.]|uniref:antibiotic biosynthesis monooxygenase family protein n=1 Tax=Algiphilus sp. TaxID=1872431 RepID=UPI003B5178E6
MTFPGPLPEGAIAVIFTSMRSADDDHGYEAMAERMLELVEAQHGYLGATSVRDPATRVGITVSYWVDESAARQWKQVAEHQLAQREGRRHWYEHYRVEVCRVVRQYDHTSSTLDD